MAENDVVRTYRVIQIGRRYSVWWSVAERQGEDLVWLDGGHVSNHRTRESAEAKADKLNATPKEPPCPIQTMTESVLRCW